MLEHHGRGGGGGVQFAQSFLWDGKSSSWHFLGFCNGLFLQRWFCSMRSSCITEAMPRSHPSLELKQSYCEILKSVPAVFAKLAWNFNFHPSLSDCSALAGNSWTDNISLVCRYIIEIWPLLMACTWKNCNLLAVFWDKISMFRLSQTEHCSTRCDGPLCAPHRDLISFIWWFSQFLLGWSPCWSRSITRDFEFSGFEFSHNLLIMMID